MTPDTDFFAKHSGPSTVNEVMTTDVISVAPYSLIEDALSIMLKNKISGLPVLDDNDRLAGVISEFDMLILLSERPEDYSPIALVADYMTTNVKVIKEDTSLDEVVDIFRKTSVRRLPVVRGDKLVGILSRRDLVRVIHKIRQAAAAQPWDPVGQGLTY